MKPIRLSAHALSKIEKRGFTIEEVEDSIRTSSWEPAELGEKQCCKNLPFGREWNGKVYSTKQIRPIFVEEEKEVVVVTVYTYFF